MTRQEITKAEKMLAQVGRVVTGKMWDDTHKISRLVISTDGDGQKQPFGTPQIFWSLDEVKHYCTG